MHSETFEERLLRYKTISLGLACAEARKERKKNDSMVFELRNKIKAIKQGKEKAEQILMTERMNEQCQQQKRIRNLSQAAEKLSSQSLQATKLKQAQEFSRSLMLHRKQTREDIKSKLVSMKRREAEALKKKKAELESLKRMKEASTLERSKSLASQVRVSKLESKENVQSFFAARKELFRSINENFLLTEMSEKNRLDAEIEHLSTQEQALMQSFKAIQRKERPKLT